MKLPCLLVILWLFAVTTASAQFTLFNKSNSNLVSDECARIGTDSLGKPWIGHSNAGISTLNNENLFINYNPSNAPLTGYFTSFVLRDGGRMWFVDYGSGLHNFNGSEWNGIENLPDYTIYGLFREGNHLWIGTKNNGLYDYNLETSTFVPYGFQSGLPGEYFFRIAGDQQGNIFAGAGYEGVLKWNGFNWTQYSSWNSPLPNDDVYCVACDDAGNMWFGTYYGLAKMTPQGSWAVYLPEYSGIPAGYIRNVVCDGPNVVVATAEGGLGILDTRTELWTVYNTQNSNLPSNEVWDVAVGNNHSLWLALLYDGIAYLPEYPNAVMEKDQPALVSLRPNPAHTNVQVMLNKGFQGSCCIRILSPQGKTVIEKQLSVTNVSRILTVNISGLSPGLYLVNAVGQGLTFTEKLVVK